MTFSLTIKTADDIASETRAKAVMSKGEFCLALYASGVLPADDADVASGGAWPQSFSGAVAALTEAERLAARVKWRTAQNVYRMDPLLLAVAAFMNADPALPDLSDAQLDAMFGI